MKILKVFIVLQLLFTSVPLFAQTETGGIPADSRQAMLVLTPTFDDTHGRLIRFARTSDQTPWRETGDTIPVIVGRKGLAWGFGLHPTEGLEGPVKKEGDKKSPAGIFSLSSIFGYAPSEEMQGVKMPYIHVINLLECIDDENSRYYNQILLRNEAVEVDWTSSEKMRSPGIWYALGAVIDYNTKNPRKGAGSCIFLHNWAGADDSTAGCTALAPENMKRVALWLDMTQKPVLVQLTKAAYVQYKKSWNLPESVKN